MLSGSGNQCGYHAVTRRVVRLSDYECCRLQGPAQSSLSGNIELYAPRAAIHHHRVTSRRHRRRRPGATRSLARERPAGGSDPELGPKPGPGVWLGLESPDQNSDSFLDSDCRSPDSHPRARTEIPTRTRTRTRARGAEETRSLGETGAPAAAAAATDIDLHCVIVLAMMSLMTGQWPISPCDNYAKP